MGNASKRPQHTVSAQLLEDVYETLSPGKDEKELKSALTSLQSSLSNVSPHAQAFAIHYHDRFLGDRAATVLVEGILRSQGSLTTLALRNCGLTSELSESFAKSLPNIPMLARLDLSQNNLANVGLLRIVPQLRSLRTLHNLELANVGAEDPIVPELIALAKSNHTLSHINLQRNLFTDHGAVQLLTLLDDFAHVTYLQIAQNAMSEENVEAVANKCNRNVQVSLVLDEILASVQYFQFQARKKHPELRKVKRERPHWKEDVVLVGENVFKHQFPQKKTKKSKAEASEPQEAAPLESSKSKEELLLNKDAASDLDRYPRARLPLMTPSARFTVGHYEAVGKRPSMEDAMLIHGRFRNHQREDLFGVFDGHGGPHVAAYVAQAFPLIFSEKLVEFPDQVDQAIIAAYQSLDAEVKPWARYLGSTAVIAYIRNSTLYVSNVGDARAVLARNGVAYRLSRDHKPDDSAETARITILGGSVHDGRVKGRLGVARAFGDGFLRDLVPADPHIVSYELSPEDDFLLLACDGVFDVYEDQDVVDAIERMIQKDADPQVWAKTTVTKSLERGTDDNVSVLIVSLNDAKLNSIAAEYRGSKKSFFASASAIPFMGDTKPSPASIGIQIITTGSQMSQ